MTPSLRCASAAAILVALAVGAMASLAAAQAPGDAAAVLASAQAPGEAKPVLAATPAPGNAAAALAAAQAPIGDAPQPIVAPRAVAADADTTLNTDCPPPRHIKRGAIIGGVIGGGAGTAFFVFLAALFDAFDDDDLGAPAYLVFGAFGLVAGGAGGALVGAHVGGQTRRGRSTCPDPVGSLTLQGGGLHFLVHDDADPGLFARATFLTHWSPHVATGGEFARMTGVPGGWRLALATRIDPTGNEARLRPYGAGSIGGNFWRNGENLLSADVGGGVEWLLDDTWSLGAESRYHWNLQNAVEPGTYRFASVVGQARLRW